MVDFNLNQEFNADDFEAESSIIEKGRYNFVIDHTELTNSKNGNQQIKIVFKVIGDKFKNYTIYERFTFATQAQAEFYMKKIAAIFRACGYQTFKLNELENIHGRELSAEVYHKFNEYYSKDEPQLRLFEAKDFDPKAVKEKTATNSNTRKPAPQPTSVDKNTPSPISKTVASKKPVAKKVDDDDDLPF